MEKRRWVYAVVGIIASVVAILIFLWIASQGLIVDGHYTIWMDLSDPVQVGSNSWIIELENVSGYHPPEHEDLEEFEIVLKVNETVIASFDQLRNGLVGHTDTIYLFFEDNGKMGRVDEGDSFYLVGLETGLDYDFRVIHKKASLIVGYVTVHT